MTLLGGPLDFFLPDSSIATVPAERRGTGRDHVRLMVTDRTPRFIEHEEFSRIDRHLSTGDVVVVNTSATVPAAVDARTEDNTQVKVHFASPAAAGLWTVEVRNPIERGGTTPGPDLSPQTLRLRGGGRLHLLARSPRTPRLWVAAVDIQRDFLGYLRAHGAPIRYIPGPAWPLATYQTVFATEPGSAEMPSAARPFTAELVTRLVSRGISVVPIVLHAGVSSYEEGESPGEERYKVSTTAAAVINTMRASGGRIIAVGTTVVRTLESVADDTGTVHPGQGLTDVLVTPQSGVRAVDGLLTGWHEPRSSHLELLEAFVSRDHLETVYEEARVNGYLWHEFGDELLILP
ncbi:MAG TPA: S-adenosylmethionine:tRNA ribosyltransferase-isomerase [Acidimicrobiia bacterium]